LLSVAIILSDLNDQLVPYLYLGAVATRIVRATSLLEYNLEVQLAFLALASQFSRKYDLGVCALGKRLQCNNKRILSKTVVFLIVNFLRFKKMP
jgi:hypothetical protein